MTITKPAGSIEHSRYAIPMLIALIAAGLAGNYFKFSITTVRNKPKTAKIYL